MCLRQLITLAICVCFSPANAADPDLAAFCLALTRRDFPLVDYQKDTALKELDYLHELRCRAEELRKNTEFASAAETVLPVESVMLPLKVDASIKRSKQANSSACEVKTRAQLLESYGQENLQVYANVIGAMGAQCIEALSGGSRPDGKIKLWGELDADTDFVRIRASYLAGYRDNQTATFDLANLTNLSCDLPAAPWWQPWRRDTNRIELESGQTPASIICRRKQPKEESSAEAANESHVLAPDRTVKFPVRRSDGTENSISSRYCPASTNQLGEAPPAEGRSNTEWRILAPMQCDAVLEIAPFLKLTTNPACWNPLPDSNPGETILLQAKFDGEEAQTLCGNEILLTVGRLHGTHTRPDLTNPQAWCDRLLLLRGQGVTITSTAKGWTGPQCAGSSGDSTSFRFRFVDPTIDSR